VYQTDTDDQDWHVCISAAVSGFHCGKITQSRVDRRLKETDSNGNVIRTAFVKDLRLTDITCRDGDSGAPVYVEPKKGMFVNAIGIVAAKDAPGNTPGPCLFSHIGHAITELREKHDIAELHVLLAPKGASSRSAARMREVPRASASVHASVARGAWRSGYAGVPLS
jgi:hypothetical protein